MLNIALNTQSMMELKNKLKTKRPNNNEQYFFNSNKKIFEVIYNNIEEILTNNKIDLKKILPKDIFEKIQSRNKKKIFEDGSIIKEIEIEIIDLLKQSITETNQRIDSREMNVSVYNEDYNNFNNIKDDNETVLSPKKGLDKTDLLYALYKDNNIFFKYNNKINNTVNNNRFVSKRKFQITSAYLTKINMPTKYSITCNHWVYPKKDDSFEPHYCKQIKHLSPADILHSQVKCPQNHLLTNIDKATPELSREVYIYYVKDVTTKSENENDNEALTLIFSFDILDEEEEIICNAVPTYDSKNSKTDYFILGWKGNNEKQKLKSKLILREKQPMFLQDIFKSIQKYFKEYHKEMVTNQNKIIALIMILQFCTQRYFKTLYPGLILGKTGSGKSYYFDVLDKILLKNAVKVEPSVRRTRFIGGQSGIDINGTGGKLFLPGYVSNRDFIFINEMADKLEEFVVRSKNKNFDENNNLFVMHKQCYDSSDNNTVDIGIQNSRKINVKATPFSVGNFTTLKTNTKIYRQRVKTIYNAFHTNIPFSYKVPLFKSINYYREELKNVPLAEAHQKARNEYEKYYMTGLEMSEQARFIFFIVIDPFSKQLEVKNPTRSKIGGIKKRTHKKEFVEELDEIMIKGLKKYEYQEKVEFLDVVYGWVWTYYKNKNSQFKFDMGEVTSHLHANLSKMNGDLLLLHKAYYNLPLTFTEEDKEMLIYFNSFNYNYLSTKETSMSVKPLNKYDKIDIDILEKNLDDGIKIKEEEELQRQEDSGSIEFQDDDNDLFGDLFE